MSTDRHRSKPQFWIILLLGSYDPATKSLLYNLKEHLAEGLMSETNQVLTLLLDDIEIYVADDTEERQQRIAVIAEKFDGKVSIFIVSNSSIVEATDLPLSAVNEQEHRVRDFITAKFRVANVVRVPLLEKLKQLSYATTLVFVLRDQELTRGGEYIELVYLLGAGRLESSRMYLLKREGIELSEMAWEILDNYGVNLRTYKDEATLYRETIRIVRNFFLRRR